MLCHGGVSSLRLEGVALKFAGREIGRSGELFDEIRAKALIAAAFGNQRATRAASYISCALKNSGEGDQVLALVHIALAGLPPLNETQEAEWRLAEAERLMTSGVPAAIILEALASEDGGPHKYSPDQPRVPAGNGRESGRWGNGSYEDGSENAGEPEETTNGSTRIEIADASDKRPDINPVGLAEAAERSKSPWLGSAPNSQHSAGVEKAIAMAIAEGDVIYSSSPLAVNVEGFVTPGSTISM